MRCLHVSDVNFSLSPLAREKKSYLCWLLQVLARMSFWTNGKMCSTLFSVFGGIKINPLVFLCLVLICVCVIWTTSVLLIGSGNSELARNDKVNGKKRHKIRAISLGSKLSGINVRLLIVDHLLSFIQTAEHFTSDMGALLVFL